MGRAASIVNMEKFAPAETISVDDGIMETNKFDLFCVIEVNKTDTLRSVRSN